MLKKYDELNHISPKAHEVLESLLSKFGSAEKLSEAIGNKVGEMTDVSEVKALIHEGFDPILNLKEVSQKHALIAINKLKASPNH